MTEAAAPDYQLPPLTTGVIRDRYKRFLADIELADGSLVTAHCPNTGAMTGCWQPGAPAQLSYSDNPKRKLAWTLERVDMGGGWIGVNTTRTNAIIERLLHLDQIAGLARHTELVREPRVFEDGADRSRMDFLLTDAGGQRTYIEVKNTSLIYNERIVFPDAVSVRALKHLKHLALLVERGHRAIILFALNRPEGHTFAPAAHIYPAYADTLQSVMAAGVEALAVRLSHTENGVDYGGVVPVDAGSASA